MKNLLILLILSITYSLNAQIQWSWQMPQPNGNTLRSAKLYNQNTGYACGESGTILKTTNGGNNWSNLNSGVNIYLYSIHIFDSLSAIICGDSGKVLKTTNGGNNWNIVNSGFSNLLISIFFNNESTGYASGSSGRIIKTTNGGLNWFSLNSSTGAPLNDIKFANINTGYCSGTRIVLKTTNAGVNWINTGVTFTDPFALAGSISVIDSNNVFAMIALDNNIAYSSNGGTNWNYYNIVLPQVSTGLDILRSIFFINVQTGYLVSDFGVICKTTNGAQSWVQDSTFKFSYPNRGVFWDVSVSNNDIYAVGGGGTIVKSTNAGSNYSLKTGWKKRLSDIYIIKQDLGFSVGYRGELYKTTNGGNNWIQKPSNTTKNLNSIYFTDNQTGYAAGDTGIILKTTNSGENWFILNSGVNNNFNDIFFQNQATGYACGTSGLILKTTNDGSNWFSTTSGTVAEINKVYFKNNDTGFAFLNSSVRITTNGGASWISQSPITATDYSFVNSNTGYVVGGAGAVAKTTNGGFNWTQIFSRSGWVFRGVHFENEMNGIAVGQDGLVTRTSNGGLNWTQLFISNNSLFSIDFINGQTGYIAGDWGNIIKTTNGGLTFIDENHNIISSDYELKQNYPNPFNPITKIKFDVPSNVKSQISIVNLSIYDITGKLIETLINKSLGSGTYEITWDASAFPTGIYFYTLKADNPESSSGQIFSQTKKMILMK